MDVRKIKGKKIINRMKQTDGMKLKHFTGI
jgi:hypothetical protein